MLTQEMLNEIMVRPGEKRGGPKHKPMSCPVCHEAYLGNGIVMCIDCEIGRRLPNVGLKKPAERGSDG